MFGGFEAAARRIVSERLRAGPPPRAATAAAAAAAADRRPLGPANHRPPLPTAASKPPAASPGRTAVHDHVPPRDNGSLQARRSAAVLAGGAGNSPNIVLPLPARRQTAAAGESSGGGRPQHAPARNSGGIRFTSPLQWQAAGGVPRTASLAALSARPDLDVPGLARRQPGRGRKRHRGRDSSSGIGCDIGPVDSAQASVGMSVRGLLPAAAAAAAAAPAQAAGLGAGAAEAEPLPPLLSDPSPDRPQQLHQQQQQYPPLSDPPLSPLAQILRHPQSHAAIHKPAKEPPPTEQQTPGQHGQDDRQQRPPKERLKRQRREQAQQQLTAPAAVATGGAGR
ncbi:hypothetical protein PLESTM_000055300 [Pleodorina starrii]|nr:hypothetical protein PLESTM_000055300 [Pleodorina starrii]